MRVAQTDEQKEAPLSGHRKKKDYVSLIRSLAAVAVCSDGNVWLSQKMMGLRYYAGNHSEPLTSLNTYLLECDEGAGALTSYSR